MGDRILVVDDDDDTRSILLVALTSNGFAVDEAADADRALALLREHAYALVMTDYDMPGKTGTQMLREAREAGILGHASTLLVTAHPEPDGREEDQRIVRKPFDIESLLRQIREILGNARLPTERTLHGDFVLDLVLYVDATSLTSRAAEQRMARILAGYDTRRVKYEVCDLIENAEQAEEDRVVFAPALVKRLPPPRAWLLGDLREARCVTEWLEMAGVPRLDA